MVLRYLYPTSSSTLTKLGATYSTLQAQNKEQKHATLITNNHSRNQTVSMHPPHPPDGNDVLGVSMEIGNQSNIAQSGNSSQSINLNNVPMDAVEGVSSPNSST